MIGVIDPNGLYLVLMFGLWISIAAAHLPGTLVLEVIAVSALTSVLSILSQYEINWLAVVLMIAGTLGCLIVPLVSQRLKRAAAGTLIAQLIFQLMGGLMLFKSGPISLAVIAPTLAITYGLHRFFLFRQQSK